MGIVAYHVYLARELYVAEATEEPRDGNVCTASLKRTGTLKTAEGSDNGKEIKDMEMG